MKAALGLALLASVLAAPASAQQSPQSDRQYEQDQDQQQAQQQEERRRQRDSGRVETLKSQSMSSPNVAGESVPEDPQTGLPRPGEDPAQLDKAHKP